MNDIVDLAEVVTEQHIQRAVYQLRELTGVDFYHCGVTIRVQNTPLFCALLAANVANYATLKATR
jgi:hypothetical protein